MSARQSNRSDACLVLDQRRSFVSLLCKVEESIVELQRTKVHVIDHIRMHAGI